MSGSAPRRPSWSPTAAAGCAGATWSVDGLEEALALSPVRLSTMGRGMDQDAASFLAAAAAGRHAASLL